MRLTDLHCSCRNGKTPRLCEFLRYPNDMLLPALLIFSGLALLACNNNAPHPQPAPVEGMANSMLVDSLLFGSQPSQEAIEELARAGYKTIVSARGENELKWNEEDLSQSHGLTFLSLPMNKPVREITDAQVERFDEIMRTGKRPMVLHCSSGNRISGLWAVWLVERQNLAPEEALRLAEQTGMKGIRPLVEKRLGLTVATAPAE